MWCVCRREGKDAKKIKTVKEEETEWKLEGFSINCQGDVSLRHLSTELTRVQEHSRSCENIFCFLLRKEMLTRKTWEVDEKERGEKNDQLNATWES